MDDPLIRVPVSTGVEYELVECDPALADTAESCEASGAEFVDSVDTS